MISHTKSYNAFKFSTAVCSDASLGCLWNNRKAGNSIHRRPDLIPQIVFSSTGKVPNRNKNNSSIKPNKFHSKYVCFGGRKTRDERKLCLKIHLFGFPQRLVTGQSTTETRKVVSASTLIGPFEFDRALATRPSNQSWGWNHLASFRCWLPGHKPLRKAEEVNFKAKFSFVTSLSAAETHVFGVKFIGLYGTVVFIAIRDFSCWGENDLWSEVWPAMDGVTGLPIISVTAFRITSLNGVRTARNSAKETSWSHIWGRKTLFQMR